MSVSTGSKGVFWELRGRMGTVDQCRDVAQVRGDRPYRYDCSRTGVGGRSGGTTDPQHDGKGQVSGKQRCCLVKVRRGRQKSRG